jgi:hypothetical protein
VFRRPGRNPALLVSGALSLTQQTAGTLAKLAVNTIVKDTAGWWDSTNNRYVPQRPGLYLVTVAFLATEALADQQVADVAAITNGPALTPVYSRWIASGSTLGPDGGASGLVLMNGTTDWLEIWGGTTKFAGCTGSEYLGVAFVE